MADESVGDGSLGMVLNLSAWIGRFLAWFIASNGSETALAEKQLNQTLTNPSTKVQRKDAINTIFDT